MAASTSSGSRQESRLPTPRNGYKAIPSPSPRTRSASVDPNVLSRPLDSGKTTSAPGSPPTMFSIAQLDNQIRTMITQMDGLVSERTTLIEAAARQRRVCILTSLSRCPCAGNSSLHVLGHRWNQHRHFPRRLASRRRMRPVRRPSQI